MSAVNRQVIEKFWADLYRRDFEAVGAYFAEDGQYTDVPSPEDDIAVGPAQIAARLRLGLGPLAAIYHHPRHMLAEGNLVVTEHAEEWHWKSGESVVVPFVSVHEFRNDGKIIRWWDYPHLQKLLDAAPQEWLEHIMKGYQ